MNKVDEILKLKELLNSGTITENEFTELKNKLLENSNSKNLDTQKKVEISIDEKECPNCNIIINKDHQKCEFCDYDFISKQIDITNTNISDGKMPRKKIFIFMVIMLFIIYAMWFLVDYTSKKNNIKNNNITPPVNKENTFKEAPDTPRLTDSAATGSYNTSESNFVFENFVGKEIYKTDYVEERCGDDYYALNENDINPMRFIVSKNEMIVKGPLVDLMINGQGITEMIISINSLTSRTLEEGKDASLYNATCSFKVIGGSYANTGAILKIWSVNDEIVSMRIVTDRKRNCRYSFMTSKIKETDAPKSSVSNSINVSNKQNQENRKAEFQGGKEAFYTYIMKNLNVPQGLKKSNAVFEVLFEIDKSGNIKATDINSSIPTTGMNEKDVKAILKDGEVISHNIYELFSRLPNWKPSFYNGKYVNSEDSIKIYLK